MVMAMDPHLSQRLELELELEFWSLIQDPGSKRTKEQKRKKKKETRLNARPHLQNRDGWRVLFSVLPCTYLVLSLALSRVHETENKTVVPNPTRPTARFGIGFFFIIIIIFLFLFLFYILYFFVSLLDQ